MVAAAMGFVGDTSQVSTGQLLNIIGADGSPFKPGLPFLVPDSPIRGGSFKGGLFVVVEGVRLGSAHAGIYHR